MGETGPSTVSLHCRLRGVGEACCSLQLCPCLVDTHLQVQIARQVQEGQLGQLGQAGGHGCERVVGQVQPCEVGQGPQGWALPTQGRGRPLLQLLLWAVHLLKAEALHRKGRGLSLLQLCRRERDSLKVLPPLWEGRPPAG